MGNETQTRILIFEISPSGHSTIEVTKFLLSSTDVPGRADADAGVDARAAQVARLGAAEGQGEQIKVQT